MRIWIVAYSGCLARNKTSQLFQKTDGDLLASAAELFDVFITMDRNIQFQQNLSSYDLKIILITAHSNRRADVEPAIPKILQILKKLKPGQVRIIEA